MFYASFKCDEASYHMRTYENGVTGNELHSADLFARPADEV
jgi:hypothetical protein